MAKLQTKPIRSAASRLGAVDLGRRTILTGGAMLLAAGVAPSARSRSVQPALNWELLPTEPFAGKQDDIAFTALDRGWYGNGLGRLYRTDDGGDRWTKIWEHPGTFIRALGFLDSDVGILGNVGMGVFPNVTDSTPLYRTGDGGHTWNAVHDIDGPTPQGICAIEVQAAASTIHAAGRVGGPAHYLRSRDQGLSWSSRDLTPQTAAIFDVKFQGPDTGFLAGSSHTDLSQARGLILRTDDGGETWREVFRSARPMETVWKLHFPSAQVGYGTLQNYDTSRMERHFVSSDDGGFTWQERPLISDASWQSFGVGFLTDRVGWIGGRRFGLQTQDGGHSWEPAGFGPAVNKLRFVCEDTVTNVFAIGQNIHRLIV